MFVFLLLVMFLLATTELGTDSWIQNIIGKVLKSPSSGTWFFIYTASIMFVLRFCAGPIVHKISPLGLLATCAALAAVGLYWLGNSGTSLVMLLSAATLYGCAKSFFWPTTLGTVSEQYPRGGALLLNAMGGVGMIAVGTIGSPAIGTLQDVDLNYALTQAAPAVHAKLAAEKDGLFCEVPIRRQGQNRISRPHRATERGTRIPRNQDEPARVSQNRHATRNHVRLLFDPDRVFPFARRLPGRGSYRARRQR